MVERYSRRRGRPETEPTRPSRAAFGVGWGALLSGTLLGVVIYGLAATAIVWAGEGRDTEAGYAAAAAAALVPLLMFLLGWFTKAPRPGRTGVSTAAVVIGLFLAGSFVARDIATGFVFALTMGAAFAVRFDPDRHDRAWRLWTAAGLAAATKLLYLVSPDLAVSVAPVLPVIGISIVDSVTERRALGG
jgi:hypothetical protein